MKSFVVPLLAVCLMTAGTVWSAAPNILFLFADDWGKYASIYAEVEGAGGINDVVRTPNFDKIARQGVLFRNAHVNALSCTPCRSTPGRATVVVRPSGDAA